MFATTPLFFAGAIFAQLNLDLRDSPVFCLCNGGGLGWEASDICVMKKMLAIDLMVQSIFILYFSLNKVNSSAVWNVLITSPKDAALLRVAPDRPPDPDRAGPLPRNLPDILSLLTSIYSPSFLGLAKILFFPLLSFVNTLIWVKNLHLLHFGTLTEGFAGFTGHSGLMHKRL